MYGMEYMQRVVVERVREMDDTKYVNIIYDTLLSISVWLLVCLSVCCIRVCVCVCIVEFLICCLKMFLLG